MWECFDRAFDFYDILADILDWVPIVAPGNNSVRTNPKQTLRRRKKKPAKEQREEMDEKLFGYPLWDIEEGRFAGGRKTEALPEKSSNTHFKRTPAKRL